MGSTEYHRRWWQNNPDRRWDYQKRHRAKQAGVPWEKIDRREILRRDGYRCQSCHRGVTLESTYPDPDYATVVTIVGFGEPGSGGHVASNLETRCPQCSWKLSGSRGRTR